MKTQLILFITLLSFSIASYSQTAETEQQKQMAKQMAAFMDQTWEAEPEDGFANLRFLVMKDGEPYAGEVSIHGRFKLLVQGIQSQHTSFNPNANGRYVLETVKPGTYNIKIEGLEEMEGFSWSREKVEVEARTAPIFEVNLSE
jgi:hypothetical protein